MRLLRYLILGIVLVPSLMCTATNHFFHTVDVKDGMADNYVRNITRDSYGYIWISTINGLSRYDGHRFRQFMPLLYGGNSNDIQAVRETADSTLWMVSSGELFTYTRRDESWRKDGIDKLAALGIEGRMKLFYVDDRNNLWVVTEEGLFHYDYAQHALIRIANYSGIPILHIVSKEGTTIIVTEDYKIYNVFLKERRLVQIGQASPTPYNRDSRVYIDNHSNLWFYYSHSLANSVKLLSLKTRQWRQLDELKQMDDFIVNTIIEDFNGNLWIGTENEGIHVFDYNENSLKWVNHTDAFKEHSSHISCFYLDNNNTMWVGSAKLGIAFTDLCAPTFDFVSTGNTEDVSCLMLDHNELLWIGFDGNGMMIKQKNGGITNLKASQQQLPSDIITSMVTLSDGTILAGTYGSGIAKYDGKRFVPIYTDYPILKYIKDIVSDSKGDLWVATVDKGVVKLTPDGKKISYYNNYIVRYKRSIVLYLNYRHIRNSISNLVHYDPETGGSISRPENINGNWNVNGGFTFNTALDSTAHWNIGTDTRMRYNNFVSYVAQEQADAEKNTTRTINLNERLSVGYRNDWLEVTIDGNLNYQHTRNELQPNANLDTWQINYGGQFLVRLPLDFELSMNLHERSRRGYNDDSMNTNELIWNGQISKPFLKNKSLIVALNFYDLLGQQSNYERWVNATSRTDTRYNSVNSYAMLHVRYRLNIFGGKVDTEGRYDKKWGNRDNRNRGGGFGGWRR